MIRRFDSDLETHLPHLHQAEGNLPKNSHHPTAQNGHSSPDPRRSDATLPEPLTFPGGDVVEALEAISELVEEIAEELAEPETATHHPLEDLQQGFLPVLRNVNFLAM